MEEASFAVVVKMPNFIKELTCPFSLDRLRPAVFRRRPDGRMSKAKSATQALHKVIMVGSGGVGKSALTLQFMYDEVSVLLLPPPKKCAATLSI